MVEKNVTQMRSGIYKNLQIWFLEQILFGALISHIADIVVLLRTREPITPPTTDGLDYQPDPMDGLGTEQTDEE